MQRAACSLNQRNRPGDTHFATGHGRQGCTAAVVFRGDVEPHGLAVALYRLDVLDDEALAVMRCQLANLEIRHAVGAGQGDKAILFLRRHPANEAEATGTGKFSGDIARLAVAEKPLAGNAVLAAGQHGAPCAAQTVLVELDAFGHRVGSALRSIDQSAVDSLLVALLQYAGHQGRGGHTGGEGEQDDQPHRGRFLGLIVVPIPLSGPYRRTVVRKAWGDSSGSLASTRSPGQAAAQTVPGSPPLRPPVPDRGLGPCARWLR